MSTTSGLDGLCSVARLAYDREVMLGTHDHGKARAHKRLVVGDQDANGHIAAPSRGSVTFTA